MSRGVEPSAAVVIQVRAHPAAVRRSEAVARSMLRRRAVDVPRAGPWGRRAGRRVGSRTRARRVRTVGFPVGVVRSRSMSRVLGGAMAGRRRRVASRGEAIQERNARAGRRVETGGAGLVRQQARRFRAPAVARGGDLPIGAPTERVTRETGRTHQVCRVRNDPACAAPTRRDARVRMVAVDRTASAARTVVLSMPGPPGAGTGRGPERAVAPGARVRTPEPQGDVREPTPAV